MAYLVAGKRYKRQSSVTDLIVNAGAKSARFCTDGSLEVEWDAGVQYYAPHARGDDVAFDQQLDFDLK